MNVDPALRISTCRKLKANPVGITPKYIIANTGIEENSIF
jgi:hypothetical protein